MSYNTPKKELPKPHYINGSPKAPTPNQENSPSSQQSSRTMSVGGSPVPQTRSSPLQNRSPNAQTNSPVVNGTPNRQTKSPSPITTPTKTNRMSMSSPLAVRPMTAQVNGIVSIPRVVMPPVKKAAPKSKLAGAIGTTTIPLDTDSLPVLSIISVRITSRRDTQGPGHKSEAEFGVGSKNLRVKALKTLAEELGLGADSKVHTHGLENLIVVVGGTTQKVELGERVLDDVLRGKKVNDEKVRCEIIKVSRLEGSVLFGVAIDRAAAQDASLYASTLSRLVTEKWNASGHQLWKSPALVKADTTLSEVIRGINNLSVQNGANGVNVLPDTKFPLRVRTTPTLDLSSQNAYLIYDIVPCVEKFVSLQKVMDEVFGNKALDSDWPERMTLVKDFFMGMKVMPKGIESEEVFTVVDVATHGDLKSTTVHIVGHGNDHESLGDSKLLVRKGAKKWFLMEEVFTSVEQPLRRFEPLLPVIKAHVAKFVHEDAPEELLGDINNKFLGCVSSSDEMLLKKGNKSLEFKRVDPVLVAWN